MSLRKDSLKLCPTLFPLAFRTPGINYDIRTNSGRPYLYFTYGASCSEVEVDCLTGDHKVNRNLTGL